MSELKVKSFSVKDLEYHKCQYKCRKLIKLQYCGSHICENTLNS